MKATDILELAKQGYKLGEIKEFIELQKSLEDEESTEADDTPEDEGKDGESGKEGDLSEELENLKKELEEKNALIKELQINNTKKNNETDKPKSDEELLSEIGELFI